MIKILMNKKYRNEVILMFILIGVSILMGILSPSKFFSVNNFSTMAFQMPEFGLISLGMMVAILTGGINLSITNTASLSGILGAYILASEFTKQNAELGILIAIITCISTAAVMGLLNGTVIAYIGVAAILATLGTMTLFEGIGLNITRGGSIAGFPYEFMALGNGSIFGIPISMIIYIFAILISYLLIERSSWGIKVYMSGSNEIATRFSGINTKKTLMLVYIFSGVMAGIAGLVIISRYNSAKIDYGSSYMMQSVSAVVLGGTSIMGGSGTILGTIIAVAIIQVVSTGLNLFGLNRYIIDIIIGSILIGVLAIRFLYQSSALKNKKSK